VAFPVSQEETHTLMNDMAAFLTAVKDHVPTELKQYFDRTLQRFNFCRER
jgi:hypothetical protein